jgi:DNA polymerase alpha subunit B
MSQEEISHNLLDGHRVGRLAGHLLKQQSFSPQFPPSGNTLSQFDFRQCEHWQFKFSPDVMILPSKLNQMARDVEGTVVVNPGSLARGTGGGTFAEITIHPIQQDACKRCRVDIKRI